MLQMWVLIKQLLQQQIGKALGTTSAADEEVIFIIQFRLLAENSGKPWRRQLLSGLAESQGKAIETTTPILIF